MAKLIVAFVHGADSGRVVSALREAELRTTALESRGGFLRARNATLMVGVEDDQVATVMDIIERNCQTRTEQVPLELLGGMDASWLPTEVRHGGATVFVLPAEDVRRF
jgi:uncharacterized protein YaaQ